MDHTPVNFDQITEHIWVGTNMCCAVHAEELHRLGFDADIDLEEERAEEPPYTAVYLWLPTRDHTPPSADQLATGVATLTEMVGRNMKVYVHCKNGHGRAPTLVAAYLVSAGKEVEEAIEFIRAKRPSIHPEDSQVAALREFTKA